MYDVLESISTVFSGAFSTPWVRWQRHSYAERNGSCEVGNIHGLGCRRIGAERPLASGNHGGLEVGGLVDRQAGNSRAGRFWLDRALAQEAPNAGSCSYGCAPRSFVIHLFVVWIACVSGDPLDQSAEMRLNESTAAHVPRFYFSLGLSSALRSPSAY
jgi:hypothetical protein